MVSVGVAPKGNMTYAVVVGSDEAGSASSLVSISTTTNSTGKVIRVGVDPRQQSKRLAVGHVVTIPCSSRVVTRYPVFVGSFFMY